MRKITLLLLVLSSAFAFAQSPTDNATDPPAREVADVISIFSDAYTNVVGTDFNPNWGQAGFNTANPNFDPGTGNLVLAYPNFNYQGNQYGSVQNIAAMEFLHVDIWINGTFNPNVFVISSGAEIAHPITNTGSETWISVDIPVAGITGDIANAIQFKFDGGNGSTDAIYVDNLYFWKNPTPPGSDATLSDLQVDGATIAGFGPGVFDYTVDLPNGTTDIPQITTATTTDPDATTNITQAPAIPGDATVEVTSQNGNVMETYTVSFIISGPSTAAPTPPTRPANDVKSIFSNRYLDSQVSVDTYDTPWCPGTTTEVMIAGNPTMKVTGLGCEGVEFVSGRFDATDFTNFHIDIFTDSPTQDASFNIKFSNWNGGAGEANALEYSFNNASNPPLPNTNPGTWISFDVLLDDFTAVNNADRNDFVQFIITSNLGTVYYDNLYLHKNTLSTDEFSTTDFNVYPNPTQNVWNVKTNNQEINTIQVFDIQGREVLAIEPKTSNAVIDASSLPAGLYFARISTPAGTNSIKLIKQ